MASLQGGSDALTTIQEFRKRCPLFAAINFPDMKVLSKYCDLRTIAPTET